MTTMTNMNVFLNTEKYQTVFYYKEIYDRIFVLGNM